MFEMTANGICCCVSYKRTEFFVAIAKIIRYGRSMAGLPVRGNSSNSSGQQRTAMVNWSDDGITIAGLFSIEAESVQNDMKEDSFTYRLVAWRLKMYVACMGLISTGFSAAPSALTDEVITSQTPAGTILFGGDSIRMSNFRSRIGVSIKNTHISSPSGVKVSLR